jgi:hypothetical protein
MPLMFEIAFVSGCYRRDRVLLRPVAHTQQSFVRQQRAVFGLR